MLWVRNGYMGNSLQALWFQPYWEDELTNAQWLQGIVTNVPNIMSHTVRITKTTSGRIRQCPSIHSFHSWRPTWNRLKQSLWKRSTPWKINMEPTNHPFWKGKWSSKPPIPTTFGLPCELSWVHPPLVHLCIYLSYLVSSELIIQRCFGRSVNLAQIQYN